MIDFEIDNENAIISRIEKNGKVQLCRRTLTIILDKKDTLYFRL